MTQVFISHYSGDVDKARSVMEAINALPDFHAVLIVERREPLKALAQEVSEGIIDSKYFVPLLTPKSRETQWVNQEIGFAVSRGKKVYPLVDKEVLHGLKGFITKEYDLPYVYREHADPDNQMTFESARKRIVEDLVAEERGVLLGVAKARLKVIVNQGFDAVDITPTYAVNAETHLVYSFFQLPDKHKYVFYFRFRTDKDEYGWIGFTNRPDTRYDEHPNERTYTEAPEAGPGIKMSVSSLVRERFAHFTGTAVEIDRFRLRGDDVNNDEIVLGVKVW